MNIKLSDCAMTRTVGPEVARILGIDGKTIVTQIDIVLEPGEVAKAVVSIAITEEQWAQFGGAVVKKP